MRNEFDINSNDNALFVTSQCNNHCLMCCQPPLKVDDIDELYERNIQMLRSAPKELKVLGITGGEPTLLGEKLISLLQEVRSALPDTAIQLLSNGRAFKDATYTKRISEAAGDNFFVGIPFHSDYSGDHNLIAGSNHAYEETMTGLYNLADNGVEIELRVVVNKLNYIRLPRMAEYIFKNLPFVSWTAFMGMERTGLSVRNTARIWVEPKDYALYLRDAVIALDDWRLDVAIYNVPLCLIPRECWPFAKRSISDWKTKYVECCDTCVVKEQCCGHFSTSTQLYEGINPISEL